MFFYYRHDPMPVLEINPIVGFVADYLHKPDSPLCFVQDLPIECTSLL